jgi:hypothetical protein
VHCKRLSRPRGAIGVTTIREADRALDTRSRALSHAVCDNSRIHASPHDLYRYPARFSPVFAGKMIQRFTEIGDVVLDPFCGGGTTIVEAIRVGRKAIGIDVSSLATFVSRAKTTPLSARDTHAIRRWAETLQARFGRSPAIVKATVVEPHYLRNLPEGAEQFFQRVIEASIPLTPRQRNYARLALLATGQWALDCKTRVPSQQEMLQFLVVRLSTGITRFSAFIKEAATNSDTQKCRLTALRRIICRSSEHCDSDLRIPRAWRPVQLVLTSPPYPGVHVVYHRWQIRGRCETPAPFWIANQKDGAGESYYTLGRRSESMLCRYYERLQTIFTSVRQIVSPESHVVQLVAFSDRTWQLREYLRVMSAAGFEEVSMAARQKHRNSRIWRTVPSRKWYAAAQKTHSASREVLLVHRPR